MNKSEIIRSIYAHEDRELAPKSTLQKKNKQELNRMLEAAKRRYRRVNKEKAKEETMKEMSEVKIEEAPDIQIPEEYDGKKITAVLEYGHTKDEYLCRGLDGTTMVEFHVPKSLFKPYAE